MQTKNEKYPSPCLRCTRVPDPRNCDNKRCQPWRQWFLDRWELLRSVPRQQMEQVVLTPNGSSIGGTRYTPPSQLQTYLRTDPCKACLCPKDLCTSPCRIRRAWEEAKGDTFI